MSIGAKGSAFILYDLQKLPCNSIGRVTRQMRRGIGTKRRRPIWAAQELCQRSGQRNMIAVWKSHSALANGFRKATKSRSDDHAAASNAFEGNDAEGFRPERRDDEDRAVVEKIREVFVSPKSSKLDL